MVTVAHLGSRPLSLDCLRIMHQHPDLSVKAVVTYPEDHEGWWDGSLNTLASELGYPVIPEAELLEYELDYLISTLYFNILDTEILDHPSQGGLNLHQAELPRYRGSNTFSHAIMNARDDDHWQYGTTFHFMSPEVDEGDIISRKFVDITETDTAWSLYQKTERASVALFEELLPAIVSGEIQEMRTPQEQIDGKRYFFSKSSLDGEKHIPMEAFVDSDTELRVYDKIRALHFPPFEPAFTTIDGRKIYLTVDYPYA